MIKVWLSKLTASFFRVSGMATLLSKYGTATLEAEQTRVPIFEKCYPGYGFAMMTLKLGIFEPNYSCYGLAMNAMIF